MSSGASAKPFDSTASTPLSASAHTSNTRPSAGTVSPSATTATTTTPSSPTPNSCFNGFKVPHISSWRNPYDTSVFLAEISGIFVFLSSSFMSRTFVKFASTLIGIASLAESGSRAISGQRNGLVSTYQPSRFSPFSDNFVHSVATYVAKSFSRAVFGVQHLIDARDPKKGLKVSAGLYAAYILLGIFNLRTSILTSIVLAFSLPPLYSQFKPEVDRTINDIHNEVHHQAKIAGDKIYAKAGPQIDYVKKSSGPRGGFPGHANVSPVGDVPTAAAKPTPYTTHGYSSTSGSASGSGLGSNSGLGSSAASGTGTGSAFGSSTSGAHQSSTAYEETAKSLPHPTETIAPSTAGLNAGVSPLGSDHKAADHTSSTSHHNATAKSSALDGVPDDTFKKFDTVPTLVGNVPIDHKKLDAALAADRAKAEGHLNGS